MLDNQDNTSCAKQSGSTRPFIHSACRYKSSCRFWFYHLERGWPREQKGGNSQKPHTWWPIYSGFSWTPL